MWRTSGLINLLGLILLTGTTAAFRFPNEGRGRSMPRTSLVPPPPPPPSPRGIRHFTGGRLAPQQQWRWPSVPPTTFGNVRSTGRYWPQQQAPSRHDRFSMQQYLSQPRQPSQQQVTSRHPRQHPQPRKLQWEPPVQTLQQAMGYDGFRPAASNQLISVSRPSASAEASIGHSPQPTIGTGSPSNNPPSHILTIDEATDICQRCEMLNPMASAACCSGHSLCCHQNIPYHSPNQFQQQTQQSYYPQQGPQLGQVQFYQQRNSHQQGQTQVPASQIFHTDNVNIYNKYDSQFNPGNVEPAYDIRDHDYDELVSPDDENLTEDDSQQEEFDSDRDRRSSLGDLVGGAVISMISIAVRMAARDGLDDLDDGDPQRQHRMFG